MTVSTSKRGSVQKCRDASNNVNQNIIGLLSAVGSRNTPGYQGALQSKVNQVRASLEALRASVNALPNIDTDIETQNQKIAALQEQLRLKNDFITKIREQNVEDLIESVSNHQEQAKDNNLEMEQN